MYIKWASGKGSKERVKEAEIKGERRQRESDSLTERRWREGEER